MPWPEYSAAVESKSGGPSGWEGPCSIDSATLAPLRVTTATSGLRHKHIGAAITTR